MVGTLEAPHAGRLAGHTGKGGARSEEMGRNGLKLLFHGLAFLIRAEGCVGERQSQVWRLRQATLGAGDHNP